MNPIDRIEQLRAECIALRTRVADYEERLSAVMPSDFKDWNQNARSEWPEVAARVIQSLVEREHFANGTAELAMHHRDIAEQRVTELEAALRDAVGMLEELDGLDWGEEGMPFDVDFNHFAKVLARVESATPAKHPDTERLDWLASNKQSGGGAFCLQWSFRDNNNQTNIRDAIDAARKLGGAHD